MKSKWVTAAISGIVLMTFLLLLLLRPSVFVHPIVEDPFIPLGNLLFWLAFIAFPIFLEAASSGFGLRFTKMARIIQKGFVIAIVLAVLWWPLSYVLSGNFANNFSPRESFVGGSQASRVFWAYSYSVVFLPIGLWVVRMLISLFGSFKR